VVAATDLAVEGFALDWRRPGRLPRADGRIVRGPLQGAGRVSDVAHVAGGTEQTGGWFGLDGEIGGTLLRPRLGSSVAVTNLQVEDWLVTKVDLEAELSGDHLVVSRAKAIAGETSETEADFMGRVDDVYGARSYNLVGALRDIALQDVPTFRRLDMEVKGRADIPQITLWGRRGEQPAGSASVNMGLVQIGSQSFRPFTGLVQFADGLVRLEATRIRRVLLGTGRTPASAGYLSLSALLQPAGRVVDAERPILTRRPRSAWWRFPTWPPPSRWRPRWCASLRRWSWSGRRSRRRQGRQRRRRQGRLRGRPSHGGWRAWPCGSLGG
jgi:hypothetical protein